MLQVRVYNSLCMFDYIELTWFACIWQWSCNLLHEIRWRFRWCWWCI